MKLGILIALLFWIYTPPVLSVYRLDLTQMLNLPLPENHVIEAMRTEVKAPTTVIVGTCYA